ncbi:hypothetical protein MSS2_03461 [Mycobacterium marinum]|uniref:hypothetical protein n=1 Tax=Mycobacterium marinum TaxID=1781 RepID=UPI000E3C847C|nr:hypothetical protein [Mycobacterium marinum]RFZ51500.1 hypothetical protein MSS2_03461 [Mycobacterium marinum]
MSQHPCPRCGLESNCSHGSWADRHPATAVMLGIPTVLFVLGAIGAYPWVFIPLIVAGAVAYTVERERRRRQALAARADWEHRALMATSLRWTPAPTLRQALPRKRRPADHWSTTQPMRTDR